MPQVARTAFSAAAQRALESSRPDRLFDDPYAQAFVAALSAATPEPDRTNPTPALAALFYSHLVVRTRFYDEYLLAATAAGCDQVVLLAAGLDTRAFRLAWPAGVRLFELDLPELLAVKERVLTGESATPRCARTVVPADLRADWSSQLRTAGFRSSAPTAWLVEGLLIYLSHDQAAELLTAVGELSAPGSQLSFETRTGDGDDAGIVSRARGLPGADSLTTLWKGGLDGHASEWLAKHGWQSRIHDRPTLAATYGRPADDPGGDGFVTAVRA
jgi:methyltransferase (TIGR00027 family)